MSEVASIDFETRSAADLRKVGLHRYFEDASTGVWCLSWRIGAGPVHSWRPGQPMPWPLIRHIQSGGRVIAHNNAFDRTCWNTFAAEHGWPLISIEQSDCTMARGAAMALPQSLDELGKALKAPIRKDLDGHRLMMQMCRPRRIEEDGTLVWWDDEDRIARLSAYCDKDVESERAIDRLVPQLSASEREVWMLDQRINDRGVAVDVVLARRALAAVEEAKKRADKRMRLLTQGRVQKVTETAKIVAWLNERGVACESIAKGEVDELLLVSDLVDEPVAREVIELRREAAKSSTAKYTAMLNQVCRDGRVRGSLRYHGASTGRWAGSGMQPQNFPRVLDPDAVAVTLDMLGGNTDPADTCDAIALFVGEPMAALSRCLRAMLVAGKDKRLLGADYSNIEGRVNAWLACEEWKVDAFRDYDAGVGDDLYKLAYARSFDIAPAAVDKSQRQIGKVMELSMGYQGGWRAFEKMGANYGVSVGRARAEELKRAWRDAHPAIVDSWWQLQNAAVDAVMHAGVTVPCLQGRIRYKVAHGFLWCRLPSGRSLAYAAPRIVWVVRDSEFKEVARYRHKLDAENKAGDTDSVKPQVEFDGVDSTTKKWGPHTLYGGLQCENVVQAISRDILVDAMLRLEEAGYRIVLTVHDEIIAEVDEGWGSEEEFQAIMSRAPEWAAGLPIAVEGWEGKRYGK